MLKQGLFLSISVISILENSLSISSRTSLLLINTLLLVKAAVATNENFEHSCPDTQNIHVDNVDIVRAGYLPDYRSSSINLNEAVMHLTDLMLFSIEPTQEGSIESSSCCLDASQYERARKAREYKLKKEEEKYWKQLQEKTLKSENNGGDVDSCTLALVPSPPLRILVTVGGGGRSSTFAKIVTSRTKRQRLITELKELCQREKLDGVDYDWEQPTTMEDYQMYLKLFQETSAEFHKPEVNLLVTVAVHTHQILPEQIYPALDRVHIMTYDIPIPRGQTKFTHHAEYKQVVHAIESFVIQGAPPKKLVLGIPCYARHYENPGDVKTFSEIVDEIKLDSSMDSITKSNLNDITTITNKKDWKKRYKYNGYVYDSPSRVMKKVQYVKEQGIGGIFFWEIGQDYQGEDLSSNGGGVLMETAAISATKFTRQKT